LNLLEFYFEQVDLALPFSEAETGWNGAPNLREGKGQIFHAKFLT